MNGYYCLKLPKVLTLMVLSCLSSAASAVGWFECALAPQFGNHTGWPLLAVFPLLYIFRVLIHVYLNYDA